MIDDLDSYVKSLNFSETKNIDRLRYWSSTFDESYKGGFIEEFNQLIDNNLSFRKYVIEYLNKKIDDNQYESSNALETLEENIVDEENKIYAESINSSVLSEPIRITKKQRLIKTTFMEVQLDNFEKEKLYKNYMKSEKITDGISW